MAFTALEVARMVVVSHLLVLTALVLPRLRGRDRLYTAMMGAGATAYLLLPIFIARGAPKMVLFPVLVVQAALTFWFWLFALSTGDHRFEPRWQHWSVLGLKLAVTVAWVSPRRPLLLSMNPEEEGVWRALIPALFSVGLTVAGVVAAGRRWDDDLDEANRRRRKYIVYWGAAAVVASAFVLLVLRGPRLGPIGAWATVTIALVACLSLYALLHSEAGEATDPTDKERTTSDRPGARSPESTHADGARAPSPSDEANRELALRVERSFREEGLYRTEGLTVRMLSAHLGELDYKVRRAINRVLGYQNFNVFLNEYRIAEAQERLRAEPDLPVVRVALDLGYRSLAGFNKAFKETTGRTPTEYRSNPSHAGDPPTKPD